MPTMLSPGIYPREIDASAYIKQISTSVCGMLGVSKKGPINDPQLVTSWEQFVGTFGDYMPEHPLAYSAKAFFDNGGASLWVNRVVHYDETKKPTSVNAEATILTGSEETNGILKISAINAGVWGNNIKIIFEKATSEIEGYFNLKISLNGEVVEFFSDIKCGKNFSSVNEKSACLQLEGDLSNAIPQLNKEYQLSGGKDGISNIDVNDYIGDPAKHTGIYSFDTVDDLNILVIPEQSDIAIIKAAIAYSENRKDIIFIADPPKGLKPQDVVKFRKDGAFNSSYAALYYPWLVINDPLLGGKKTISPSGAVAGCYSRNDQIANVWDAPAGVLRGKIINVLGLEYFVTRGEQDALYPKGINPIVVSSVTGINIWGQKTLQGLPSATDRINVRRLMMYMEKAIVGSSKFVVFQPSHSKTWKALGRQIIPFLRDIRNRGGLYDFLFQCDEETNTPMSIDRNELIARIFVKPTKTAEMIQLDFIIAGNDANFKELV